MRRFILQNAPGYDAHKHSCELCLLQFGCGDIECEDSVFTCNDCLNIPPRCTGCSATLVTPGWSSESSYGTRTPWGAECPNCKMVVCYVEYSDDGRGPMRAATEYLPILPAGYTSRVVPFTSTAIAKTAKQMEAFMMADAGIDAKDDQ